MPVCGKLVCMPGTISIVENLTVIELLLEYGRDPRLYSISVGVTAIHMLLKRQHSDDKEDREEHRAFWKHLLRISEEAAVRIEAKKEESKTSEEYVRINMEERSSDAYTNPRNPGTFQLANEYGANGTHRSSPSDQMLI